MLVHSLVTLLPSPKNTRIMRWWVLMRLVHCSYTWFVPWGMIQRSYRVLQKKQSCQTHCEETCMPPFPQFNVVTSLCFERPSKKKQPFRFGCRHALGNNIDQGGARGSGVMWQHVGGWLFFLKNPGKIFWLMDVQLQVWTNSLLHLPKPQSKHTRSFKAATHHTKTQQIFFSFMDVQTQAWTNSLLHVPKPQSKHTFIFRASTHKQRSNIAAFAPHVGKNWRSELRVLHGALM